MMKLTVKELRDFLDQYDLDDNAIVYYQRIEDCYFAEAGGWKEKVMFKEPDMGEVSDEFIPAFACIKFHNDGNLYITAHY